VLLPDRGSWFALGGRVYGCDDCQEVCPPNRLDERRHDAQPAMPSAQPWVDLIAMLTMTDAELLATFGRWYVPDRDPDALRRNALVALGNVGDPDDPRVTAAVRNALVSSVPIIRAHAVWAAKRLGLTHDIERMGDRERDQLVLDELGAKVAARPA
jgi:epoxyqueuosine reductase